jgi:catalase
MFWDFHNNNQEGVHTLMQLFGGRGIPASLSNVNGFGNHTFKLGKTNPPDESGSFVYCKFHFKPKAGIKNLDPQEALRLAGIDPDYHVISMFNAIERGDFPEWTLYIQTMTPEQAEKAGDITFDITKVWPHKDYPLQEVGVMKLTRNPDNFFAEIEQASFSPSAMPPGIAPSADIMLQARMFSYPDAARYRLGPNYQQIPCNMPISTVYSPYQRDGPGSVNGNYGADPGRYGLHLLPRSQLIY